MLISYYLANFLIFFSMYYFCLRNNVSVIWSSQIFRIKPPMCITIEDVDFSIAVIRKSIASFLEKK